MASNTTAAEQDVQNQNHINNDVPAVVISDLHKSFGNLQVLKGVNCLLYTSDAADEPRHV